MLRVLQVIACLVVIYASSHSFWLFPEDTRDDEPEGKRPVQQTPV